MYAKCGALSKALEVFHELPVRHLCSWNALLSGYAHHGLGKEALACFCQMQSAGLSPDAITYACTLKACGITKEVDFGEHVHDEIVSQGFSGNIMIGNALINMYAKCGILSKAQDVLDELPVRDVVSWTTLIAGYAQQGQSDEAIICYDQMRDEGICPNAITYACILKAYGIAKEVDNGKKIHETIATERLLQKDVVLGTALVDMYAKCGVLTKARQVLDELPVRDGVLWNALIAGYAQQEQSEMAILCYEQLRHEAISPDAVTYACMLKACGIAKEVKKGNQIHEEISSQGLLEKDAVLGNALVDMYAKCGMLNKARQVLEELPVRSIISWSALLAGYEQEGWGEEASDCFKRMQSDGIIPNAVSWNTLLGGYAQQGESEKALGCFHRMQHDGIPPDVTTFVCVLSACSHSGLVDEGQILFNSMEERFGIMPNMEHHVCMVDLCGRAGQFHKAMAVIEKLPPSHYLAVWLALLGACRKWGNVQLGRLAFEHAVQIDERDGAAHAGMENIYVAASMGEEA